MTGNEDNCRNFKQIVKRESKVSLQMHKFDQKEFGEHVLNDKLI